MLDIRTVKIQLKKAELIIKAILLAPHTLRINNNWHHLILADLKQLAKLLKINKPRPKIIHTIR